MAANKPRRPFDHARFRLRLPPYAAAGLLSLCAALLFLDWFVSDPLRAAKVDRYILFSMSETAHFCYARLAFLDPFVLLNPNAKPLYELLAGAALFLFPAGLFTLKALNSLLCVGTLLLLFKLARRLGQSEPFACITLLITVTFPLFFLSSVASLSELLFCFLLVAAVYSFSARRQRLSAVIVSLLPLVRQEGTLYCLIWLYFLIREGKGRFSWMLFAPLLAWIAANTLILGHSPVYPFFVSIDLPGPTSPYELMPGPAFADFAPLIFFHPAFMLLIPGLAMKWRDIRYRPVVIPLTAHFLFLAAGVGLQFAIIGKLSSEFRYVAVLMPFVALLASAALENISVVIPAKLRGPALAAGMFALLAMLILGIGAFQESLPARVNRVSERQELSLREAARWIEERVKAGGDVDVFYPGELTTDPLMRRLKFHLPARVSLLPVRQFREVYDPVRFTLLRKEFHGPGRGLALVFDRERQTGMLGGKENQLLVSFPDIPLFIYGGKAEER